MDDLVALFRQFWVVWLMAIFVGIVFWAYRPKNRKRFERDAHIIFDEQSDENSRHADKG